MTKYQKGISGNPSGRPKGVPNKQTQLVKLLEPHAETLINKMVEMALQGDPTSLRLCIERLIPKKTDKSKIVVPDLGTIATEQLIPELLKLFSGQEVAISDIKELIEILLAYPNSMKTTNEDLRINTNDPNEAARIYAKIMRGGR